MNTNLIRKCLDELEKKEPSIPYLKGILESIIELGGNPPYVPPFHSGVGPGVSTTTIKVDEVIGDAAKRYLESTNVGNIAATT